jgi:hypothetical protein
MKPVPEAAVGAVRDTLRESGEPVSAAGLTFMQARTANEVLKAQERRIRLQQMKGELVDRAKAVAQGVPARPGRARRLGQLAGAGGGDDGRRTRSRHAQAAYGARAPCQGPLGRARRDSAEPALTHKETGDMEAVLDALVRHLPPWRLTRFLEAAIGPALLVIALVILGHAMGLIALPG